MGCSGLKLNITNFYILHFKFSNHQRKFIVFSQIIISVRLILVKIWPKFKWGQSKRWPLPQISSGAMAPSIPPPMGINHKTYKFRAKNMLQSCIFIVRALSASSTLYRTIRGTCPPPISFTPKLRYTIVICKT